MEVMDTDTNSMKLELALKKAAKIICGLKCGLCPMREENFSGCPYPCTEDVRPWQCWVEHIRELGEYYNEPGKKVV